MDHRWRHWGQTRVSGLPTLVGSSKAPYSDFVWGCPALVRTHKEVYCFHWLHPSCAPCPSCKWCQAAARSLYPENQAVAIVLHVGHTLFLVLIESWLSACRRVSRLCGRIGSARKEMSNQTALSLSHMPSLYCFYPLFLWFLCHNFSSNCPV